MRKRLFLISMLGLMLAGGTITYADVDYSSETIVKEVQTALNKEGYDCGMPDDKAGSATKQAISDYRKDKGLSADGDIDKELCDALDVFTEIEFVDATKEQLAQIGDTDVLGQQCGLVCLQINGIGDSEITRWGNFTQVGQMVIMDFIVNVDEKELLFNCMYIPGDTPSWTVRYVQGFDDGKYYYLGEGYEGDYDVYNLRTGELKEEAANVDDLIANFTNASGNVPKSVEFGTLLDANPNGGSNGNTLVIKAKIEPSFTNKMTITQNYHNIVDIVKTQGCDTYDAIDYWAVADMTDGSEGKVISFLVDSATIQGIKAESIVATTLEDHLQDLWVLPSLLN